MKTLNRRIPNRRYKAPPTIVEFAPVKLADTLTKLMMKFPPISMMHEIVGIQPMTGPTGLIFTLHARYGDPRVTQRAAYDRAMGAIHVC